MVHSARRRPLCAGPIRGDLFSFATRPASFSSSDPYVFPLCLVGGFPSPFLASENVGSFQHHEDTRASGTSFPISSLIIQFFFLMISSLEWTPSPISLLSPLEVLWGSNMNGRRKPKGGASISQVPSVSSPGDPPPPPLLVGRGLLCFRSPAGLCR